MVAACLLFVGIDAQAADPATNALPTNGQIAAGNASISTAGTAAAPVMNINQTSQRAVVNWDKFDVGAAATVNFNQPNAQASTLNRVSDANPSKIFGKINAPGEVILVNQAGVYFSPSSSLDVGAVVATTHNISDADHMAGKATYDRNGATGKVINEGNIKTALGGYVALLAPEVRNSGVIVAQMGTVVLAAGERVTLNFDASRHLASITTTPSTIDALIENRNAVKAPGGLIILSAKAVNTLTAGVIKQSGTLSASADANTITNKGGRILLTANTVKLEAGSQTLARGPAGGGEVHVTATQTATVEATAKVSVSATQTGDAGTITIHADEKTTINGTLLAQGGQQSGNGGTINTTSNGQVEIGNTASVKAGVRGTAPNQVNGTWNVTSAAMQINTTNAGVISQSLNTNNVAIKANVTQLSIAADAVIQKTSPVLTSLNLEGAQSVTIAGQILSSPLSPITLQILSQNSVDLQQTSSIQSREVLVAAPNINSVGDVYAYLFGGNNGAIPLISFLASRISVAGNLRSDSNLRAGKISLLGTDEVAITNANISANGNDGGEIQIISMNGTVNLTNSVVQTNGGEGRGGAISVAGLQSTILSGSTLEATGKNQGGKILVGNDAKNGTLPFSVYTSLDASSILNARQLSTTNSNGGFIETSGHVLDQLATINAGRGGMWLIDPTDYTIGPTNYSGFETDLNSGMDVMINTSGVIYVISSINATGSGNLTLTAGTDIRLGASLYANSITLNAPGVLYTTVAGPVLSGPNGVTITVNSFNWLIAGGMPNIQNSGLVTIQPYGASFANAINLDWFTLSSISGFVWGKSGNTATLNANVSRTVAGSITLYGGEINLAANLTATGSGSITLNLATGYTLRTVYLTYPVLTAPNGITISADQFNWSGSNPTLSTSGIVTIQPTSASFGQGVSSSWFTLSGTPSGFVFGKSGNTAAISVPNDLSFSNDISLYGALTLNANRSITSTGGTITLSGSVDSDAANTPRTLTLNAGTGTITMSAAVGGTFALGSITATAATFNATSIALSSASTLSITNTANSAITGVISGSAALTKAGTGTLTLSGANTYTGITTINGGTLSVSSLANGGTASGIGQSTNVATNLVINGGTLQYTGAAASTDRLFKVGANGATIDASGTGALTFSNSGITDKVAGTSPTLTLTGSGTATLSASWGNPATSGTSSLTKTGAGSWVLSNSGAGTSQYTGATSILGGVLSIVAGVNGHPIAVGASLYIDGATLRFTGSTFYSLAGIVFSIGANGATLDASASSLFSIPAPTVTDATNPTLTLTGTGSGSLTTAFNNPATSGTSTLTKTGSGVWTVVSSAYTGVTTISGGTLSVATLANGGVVSGLGKSSNAASNLVINGGTLQYTGANVSTDRLFTIGANGATIDSAGSQALTFSNTGSLVVAAASSPTLTLTGTANATLNSILPDPATSGVLNIIKTGSNYWSLGAANTYTGTTTISQGPLNLFNANALGLSTTNVDIRPGGTLYIGAFTVGRKITLGGGAIYGTGTLTGDITLTGNSTFYGASASAPLTVSSLISDAGLGFGLNVGVSGYTYNVKLSNANNAYSGATTVNYGTLTFGDANAIPTTSNLIINPNGILDSVGLTISKSITLAGGAITNSVTGGSYTGAITLTANSTLKGSNGPILTIAGAGIGESGGSWSITMSSDTGYGRVLYSVPNTYTGATNISGAILQLGVDSALDNTSAVYVGSSAIFGTLDLYGHTTSKLITTGTYGTANIINSTGTGEAKGGITINAYLNIYAYRGATLRVSGAAITGLNKSVTIGGSCGSSCTNYDGTVIFANSVANTYLGNTSVSYGTLQLGAATANLIPSGTTLTVNAAATFDVAGYSFDGALSIGATGLVMSSVGTTGQLTGGVLITGSSASISAAANSVLTIKTGSISGSSGSILFGTATNTGTVVINSATTFTGGMTVSYGKVQVGNAAALGPTTGAGPVTVSSGAVLDLNGQTLTNSGSLNISGTGINSSGALMNGSVTGATYAGSLLLGSAASIVADTGSITFTKVGTTTGAYLLTLDGAQGGSIASVIATAAGGVTKAGSGTWTLSAVNTYTGATTISAGTLQLGTGGSLSSSTQVTMSGSASFDLNGNNLSLSFLTGAANNLIYNSKSGTTSTLNLSGATTTTYAGVIADNTGTGGTIALTRSSSSALAVFTLSGANTYTGGTTISGGVLAISSDGNLGAVPSSFTANAITLSGGELRATASASLDAKRGVTLTAASTLSAAAGNTLTVNGIIDGAFGLNINVSTITGTVLLAGANTYSGNTSINFGTLKVGSATALGSGNASVTNGAVLDLNGQTMTSTGGLTLNGAGISSGGALINSSSAPATYAGLIALGTTAVSIIGDGGTIALTNSGTISGSVIFTLGGTQGGSIASIISNGSAGLIKKDSGTWTLTGSNTYTGSTQINGGVLSVSVLANGGVASGIGQSSFSVNSLIIDGGTLKYTGVAASTDRSFKLGPSGGSIDASGTGLLSFTSTAAVSFTTTYISPTLTLTGTGSGSLMNTLQDYAVTTYPLSLTKTGSGSWVVKNSNNAYTGNTNINGGILQLGTANPFGSTALVTVNNGGTLDVNNFTFDKAPTLSGGMVINSNGQNGALSRGITLTANSTLAAASGATLIVTGTYAITGAYGLTIGSGSNLGKVTLAGKAVTDTNSYTGVTTVSAGATLDLLYDGTPTFRSSYDGAGTIILEPLTSGSNGKVELGASGAALYTLYLPTNLFASGASNKFADGFANIVIGNITGGNLSVTGTAAFMDSVTLLSGGNITINASASVTTSQASGNLVVAATGTCSTTPCGFINNSGVNALQTLDSGSADRWIVYTNNPTNAKFGPVGGILASSNKAFWGSTYASLAPSSIDAGNRYVFSIGGTVTVTTTSASMTYGLPINLSSNYTVSNASMDAAPTGSPYISNVTSDLFATAPTITSTGNTALAAVGQYDITASGAVGATGFSTISYTNTGKLTVNPATITLGVVGTKTYDGSAIFNTGVTVNGLANGDTLGTATANSANVADNGSNYFVSFTLSSGTASNYVLVSGYNAATNAATINKASAYVLVTAGQSSTYGLTPTINYTFYSNAAGTGGSAISASTSGTATITNAPTASSNAATYALTYASGLTADNYTFNPASGSVNYVVNKASAYVLVTAGQSSTYGLTPTINYTFYSNAAGTGGSAISTSTSGTATITNAPTATSNAATYALTYASGLSSTNYTFNPASGAVNYVVNRAPLVITGATKNLTYNGSAQTNSGGTFAVNGGSATAFSGTSLSTGIGSDGFTVAGYGTGTNANTYADNLSATRAGSTVAGNYSITYQNGSLTIDKANAYVLIAANQSSTYGATPTINYSYYSTASGTGGASITSPAGLAGSATITNAPTASSNAATYALTYASGLSSTNYLFNPATSAVDYVVNPAVLVITAPHTSVTYDGTLQSNSGGTFKLNGGTATAISNGRVSTGIGSESFDISGYGSGINASATAYADSLVATEGSGTLASNYTISYQHGSLTINKATIVVNSSNTTTTYDGTAKQNSATATVNGTATSFSSVLGGSFISAPGSSPINSTSIGNYIYLHTGFADDVFAISGAAARTNVGTTADNFALTAVGLMGTLASNYDIVYNNRQLIVNPAPLGVSVSGTYSGSTTIAPTSFQFSGLVNNETVTALTSATVNNANVSSNGANYVTALVSGGGTADLSNYVITAGYHAGSVGTNTNGVFSGSTSGTATNAGGSNTATLNKADAYVLVSSGQSSVYGTAPTTINYTLNTSAAGNGSAITSPLGLSGSASFTGLPSATSVVNTYGVNYDTGLSATNYNFNPAASNTNFLVTRAALSITASAQSTTYGTALVLGTNNTGATRYTVTGLVNSDAVTAVDLQYSGNATVAATTAANTYTNGIVASNATGTGLSNYTISYSPANLVVNTKALTITANADSKTYGTAKTYGAGSTAFTSSGLVNSETIATVTIADTNSGGLATANAGGTYALTPSAATGGTFTTSNYSITYTASALTVNKATLTVTADAKTMTYGGTSLPTLTTTITGFVNSQNLGSSGVTGSASLSTTATAYDGSNAGSASVVGNYTITPILGSLAATNYNFTYATGTLSVGKANLTITAANDSKTYGATTTAASVAYTSGVAANASTGYTTAGLVNGDTITDVTLTSTGANATATVAGGPYTITPSALTGSSRTTSANYNITYTNAATGLTVNPATLTYTATAATSIYGSTPSVNAGSVTGFVNSDTQGTATTGTLVFTTSATDHSNVGSYAINGSGLTSNTSNYVFAQAAGNATALTINPFAVIIEANRYYDGTRAISQVDFMVPGGLNTNGERVSVATGNATVSSANAGIYSNVTFSNLTIRVDDGFGGSRPTSNYTFNTTGGVQIIPAPLTIRPDAKAMTYGSTVPTLTFTYTGQVAGETPNFTGSLYTYVNSTTNAGSHSIDLGTLQATGNYQIMRGVNQYYVTANVVVNPAPLNLSISKVYTGTTGFTSANTYTVTGMVNSETAPLISGGSAATSSANAGTYNSFATNTLTSSNLNYTFVGGNITATVNPATLTLVATPTASVYGATPSVNAGSVTGFVNNETGTVLSGTLVFSTPATASSPIGHYAINGAGLSANNGNYVFVQAAANATALNIVQANIVITPNNQTGTYGTALNLGTTAFTATGLLNGDSLTGVTLLYGGNSVVPATLAAGTYTNGIVSSAATGSAGISNYSITYNTANLTINKATLTVSADNQTKTYGDVNPALTYTISGYVNNQNFGNAGITGTASTSTTARQGSDVGTYTISTVANNLAAANYDFSYADGTLTVNRRPVTVTADNKSKTYGDVNPVLTYAVAANGVGTSRGLYGTDALTGDPATSATQATGVGYPAITQGGLTNTNNGNYAITFNNGTLTINPAQLTVTANADAKFVTQSDATNFKGVNYTGFVNGDTATNLSGTLSVIRTNASQNNAAVYNGVLQASGLTSANYNITYVTGNYTIIPAQTLLVDVNNQNITYGAAPTFVIDSVKYLDGQNLIHTLTQDSRNGDTYTYSDGVGGSATFTLTTSAGLSSSNHLVVGNYSLLGANFSKVSNNFNNVPVYTGNLAVQQKALTAGTSSVSKVYDGSASMANLNISLNPIVSGDVVTASGQGAFSQAGVGSGLSYSVSNLALTGTDAGNYYLSGGTSFSDNNGEITKAPLGIAVTASYNGTSTVTPTAATLTGLVNNETLTVTSVGLNAANVAANTTNYVTAILASSGTASLDNYALNTARNATLATSTTNKVTLNPVAITVTANNQSRVYGAANPTSGAVTLTSGTLYGGDTLSTASLSSAAVSTTAAGQVLSLVPTSQTFTVSNAAQNYTINYANGTLTVNKAPIGIQVAGTYNGTTTITPSSVTITGLANGETLNPSAVMVNDKNVAANGSNYVTAITPTAGDTAALSNYEFALAYNGASATTTTNAVTINKANLSVTATPSLTGNVYNGSAYTGAYTTTAVNGETFTVTGVATGTNAATYASNLVVTGAALDNYNTPIINNANLVISPKAVTITNAASSSTYDGVTSYAGLMNTAGFTNTALVGSDSIASVTQTATVSGSTVTGVAQAGTFVATPSVAVMGVGLLTNYAFTYQTATNTVAKANLMVTANNATKTYDGLVYTGGNGVTYVGLVGGEQSTVLGGLIAYNGTSQNAINAAAYTIIPSGLTSNNYEISYTSGTLTVNPKSITITANAQSTTYGTALALGTSAYTISNGTLATGDAISAVTLQYNGNATVAATTNAGTYTGGIVASGATGTGRFNTSNYNITYAAGTLTVNKATLTVTADGQSRVYGDANPSFTQTISGFVNGQILATSGVTGSAYGSTTATAASSIGPYTITASASGLTSNNYQFATVNGTLTVNPRPITVTADAKTKVYGSANPALTYAVAADGVGTSRGLYGSDVLSGALSVNAGTATAVGNVAIAQNTVSNTNYAIAYVAGNLSITPATLSVTGYKTYDGSIVIAGTDLTVTGVNGERFTAGGNANLISKNVQASQHLADVSGITLTPLGGALVSNYAPLDVANTQFTVYVKAVTLTAPSISKTYDGGYAYNMTSADLASMSTQLVGGDSVSAASVSYATNSAGPNKRVDLNSVTISDGNGGANYSVTRSYSSTSVINKAPLIIKAADDAKFVTTQDAAGFSGVYGDGFVNGEGLSNLTAPATIVTRSNASVNSAGNYVGVLVPGVYTSNNYNISYQNGTYTIVPAQTLLIRVAPTNVTYGAITSTSAPAYTYTAQYLPAATVNNPNPTPVSLATPAPVNGVYLINDNVGSTASFSIGAVSPAYSSTNRLAVGGYDMIEKNAVVTGGNFLSMLTVGALTVAPKVISATNLGIAGMSKVYDGSAAISGALLNVNSAGSQLLSGDVVNVYATGSYDDANVGSAKSIVVDVSLSTPSNLTNDAANYSLSSTRVTGNLGAITQLAQVTWTGGGSSNNWSNASNWLNGAIPTFSIAANLPNVANVIIPTNANVVYDSASIGNSGSAITNNGTITFNGANNFTWTDNVSGVGNLSLTGAGTLTLAGNNTYSGGTNIHSSTLMLGAVNALAGNVLTTSGGKLGLVNGITLPGLTVNGDLTLVSDMRTSGAQIYNGQLGLGQSLSLTASAVTFNDAVGKVMLSNQSGTYDYKTNDYYNIYTNLHRVNGVDVYNLAVLADSVHLNADVVTYGTQTYGSSTRLTRVIIGDNGRNGTTRVLVSEDPAVTFWGTVDDAVANTHDLVVKAVTYTGLETPTIDFNGNVGAIAMLKSLTTEVGSQETIGTPVFAKIAVGSGSALGTVTINGTVTTAATVAQAAAIAAAAKANQANGSGAGWLLKQINRNYDVLPELKLASVEVGEATLLDSAATKVETTLCLKNNKLLHECGEEN